MSRIIDFAKAAMALRIKKAGVKGAAAADVWAKLAAISEGRQEFRKIEPQKAFKMRIRKLMQPKASIPEFFAKVYERLISERDGPYHIVMVASNSDGSRMQMSFFGTDDVEHARELFREGLRLTNKIDPAMPDQAGADDDEEFEDFMDGPPYDEGA